jgi:N-acyl homoserine lactone hydrolase
MPMSRWFPTALALVTVVAVSAQTRRETPRTPRIYIFDAGTISGFDTKMFGFAPNELKEPTLRMTAYLIVHPRGTLMFDSGGLPDAALPSDGSPVRQGPYLVTRPLLPQLAAAGYAPSDVTYFALSHYHSDHTANANPFVGATWIVQEAERDAMFAEKPASSSIQPAHFSALKMAKTKLLRNEDFDVFGDGTVIIKSTPGHTPGHQAVFVRLAKTGPVLLAGDLYHYPEERTTGNTPTFEFNAEQSRASRSKMEAFLKQTGAKLWIAHDIAAHQDLPTPPQYTE